MVHFPASLSVSRIAGSSDTQNVCEDDKVQKQDWKQSLEKKFCVPPARPRSGSRRRRQQGPRGSQRSTGRRVVNQKCVPEGRGSVRRDGLFKDFGSLYQKASRR